MFLILILFLSFIPSTSSSCISNTSGACENEDDLNIYRTYSQELTQYSKNCALLSLINTNYVQYCFEHYIGFTPDCGECWTQNVKCTYQHCFSICLKSVLLREQNNFPNGSLNECLQCDEDQCGKEFLKCAGANRRNNGIVTDIIRPNEEICSKEK